MAEGRTPPTQDTGDSSGATATATRGKPTTANGTAATVTGAQAALQGVAQLKDTVDQLEKELQGYNDAHVVGRDTILLRSFFDQAVARIMQVSEACKINWTPPVNPSRGR